MSQVAVKHVDKIYEGRNHVLKDISLDIESGEFLVLLGPSGCGKTTLLNCIAGLLDVEGGRIEIGGRDVTNLDPSDRDIAMVFQSYALYPTKTVYGNMAFCLRMKRKRKDVIDRKVRETAELLQISELLNRKPVTLSGGQRQRAAIGRALVRDAAVCLFDEPLSNLDAKLRMEMRVELKKLHKTIRSTFIYVTHDQVEAMTLATRIAVMNEGTFSQISTPDELYAHPANTFVANFIGSPSINFVPGRIARDGRADPGQDGGPDRLRRVLVPLRRPAVRGDEGHPRPAPRAVPPAGAGAATYPLRLNIVEPLGANVLCYCSLGRTEIVASLNPSDLAGAKSDEELPLAIDLSKISIFDAESSLRL